MRSWRSGLSIGLLLATAALAAACSSGGSSTPTPAATAAATTGATAAPTADATAAATATVSTAPVTLTIFSAGTLSNPLTEVDKQFMAKYPNVKIEAQFGGSVKETKQVTELGLTADIVAVADYSVIPKYMMPSSGKTFADWYIGFASNAITFVYTPQSKGAADITADNWYRALAEPGVRIGRSNPDTDPSGYQTLQMLKLAEQYYHQPGLSDAILANAPKTYIRDTETDLIGALQTGEIDYLAIYKSDAIQHDFKYIPLPPQIDLSDASQAAAYAQATVSTANGDLSANPITYALTIPTNAEQPEWAARWIAFLLGPDGQKILADRGFGDVQPAIAQNAARLPASLQPLTKPWPGS